MDQIETDITYYRQKQLILDQIHKSYNEPVSSPTMHHFGTEM